VKRTIELNATWEAEYDFGVGFWARIKRIAFDWAVRDCERTLVFGPTLKGGPQAIADKLAVESLIIASRPTPEQPDE
jgi:hypothetical protein